MIKYLCTLLSAYPEKRVYGLQSNSGTGGDTDYAKSAAEKAARAYELIISREAEAGWEFLCFDSTTVNQVACCNNQTFVRKLLVFVKRS